MTSRKVHSMLLLLLCSVCLLPSWGWAGEYELIRDESPCQACEAILKNLKALNDPPMVCDRKFHPDFPQFTQPQWADMDSWEHRDLIRQIERYRWRANPKLEQAFDQNLEKWLGLLKARIARGDIQLSKATLKWHDQSLDVVRYISESECDPIKQWSSPGGRRYVIVKDQTTLDIAKMKRSIFQSTGGHSRPDLFFYTGILHMAWWGGGSSPEYGGKVYLVGEDGGYCEIEYRATHERSRQP